MEIRLNTILLIAMTAMLAACGRAPEPGAQVSFMDVAQAAARQEDRVSVEELAEWLIEERKDFVLVDVRPHDDYMKATAPRTRPRQPRCCGLRASMPTS